MHRVCTHVRSEGKGQGRANTTGHGLLRKRSLREKAGQDSYSDGGMQRKWESHPPTPFKPPSSAVSLTSPGQLVLVRRGWRSGARADVVSCSPRWPRLAQLRALMALQH